ncbi:TPA: hypothetical protein N2C53_005780 [Pseudomonas aeruginosa]|nr:hypothetical protein [Pseudomonas aeruginosa]
MASRHIETYCQDLLFPVGALILSEGIDRLVRAGRLDPIPYFRRHTRGDWGDVNIQQWQTNSSALQSGASLESHYVIHPGLAIRIVTDSQRCATVIVLPSED